MDEAQPSKKLRVDEFTEDIADSFQMDADKVDNFVRPEELEKLGEAPISMRMDEAPPSKKLRLDEFTEDIDADSFQMDADKFDNFVRPEELKKLREAPISRRMDEASSSTNMRLDEFTEDIDADSFQVDADKFDNFVRPEEVEKLREFQVLDEVKPNDEDSEEGESDDDDNDGGKSEEVPDDEIEKMLEEGLPDEFKVPPKPKEKPYITRQKTVLEEKGVNQFEVLPLDWMMVRHYSGMAVYMHRGTRVCTLAKPYSLGKGNTRRHDIPISAIPCLAYRRALEEEEKQKLIDEKIKEQIESGSWAKKLNNQTQREDNNENSSQASGTAGQDSQANNTSNLTNENLMEEVTKQLSNEIRELTEEIIIKDKINIDIVEENVKLQCPFKHPRDGENIENEDSVGKENDKNEVENAKDQEEVAKENQNVVIINEAGNNETPLNQQPVVLPGGIVMAPPRVETVNTSWKTQQLTPDQVNDYCKKLFKFKTVNIMHFRRWADRRKHAKARKTLQYPTLPEGTKLITIPAQPSTGQDGGKASKRDWVMNMNGRSYLSVFHEYVRRALQKQPVYEFKQLENASMPYQATVKIGGMQYGSGRGTSKRQAKSAAARASINILIPEMSAELDAPAPEPDFTFFEHVGIEDPRISEFCAATCEPSPHAILRTCLVRNFGAQDRHIHTEMKKLEYQKIELTMRVGRHSATVVCKNKKAAKQRASQAILQALHPQVRSWGALLRLYGSRSVKSCKEKKLEEQQITLLQDKARHNEPNYAVLEKLREEMRKLKERDEAVVPIGTLLLEDDLPSHSGSNLNTVQL